MARSREQVEENIRKIADWMRQHPDQPASRVVPWARQHLHWWPSGKCIRAAAESVGKEMRTRPGGGLKAALGAKPPVRHARLSHLEGELVNTVRVMRERGLWRLEINLRTKEIQTESSKTLKLGE